MQEKSPIKKRIIQFIDNKSISKYKFYKITGISRGVLDQNTGLSEDNIARFIAAFPDINPEWLLTGRGPMLRSPAQPATAAQAPPVESPQPPPIPLLAAHQLAALSPAGTPPAPPPGAPLYLIPEFAQAAALFRLSGDAMAPTLLPGDLLALRPVSPQPLLQWHRPHLALTDQGPLVRRILPPQAATPARPSQPEHLLLRADNPAYPDVTLPLPHLRALFLIIGFLRIE